MAGGSLSLKTVSITLQPQSGFTLEPTETNGNQATGRRKKTTGWPVLVVGGNRSYYRLTCAAPGMVWAYTF